jgi:hypothetical protein
MERAGTATGAENSMDKIAIYTSLSDALDGYCKDQMPGRSPWGSRSEARRDLSAYYDTLCQEEADRRGVSVSAIRKAGPGVSPFFPGIAAMFDFYGKPSIRQRIMPRADVGTVPS